MAIAIGESYALPAHQPRTPSRNWSSNRRLLWRRSLRRSQDKLLRGKSTILMAIGPLVMLATTSPLGGEVINDGEENDRYFLVE